MDIMQVDVLQNIHVLYVGYAYLSSILNVSNKWKPNQSLLIFIIADETRIRCLSDSNLPEFEINDFETNIN